MTLADLTVLALLAVNVGLLVLAHYSNNLTRLALRRERLLLAIIIADEHGDDTSALRAALAIEIGWQSRYGRRLLRRVPLPPAAEWSL